MESAQLQRTAQKVERELGPTGSHPESQDPVGTSTHPAYSGTMNTQENSPRRRLAAGPNLGEHGRAHFLDPAPISCSALASLLLFHPTIPPWYKSLSHLRQ